jgi:WD40 repeat protein
VVFHVAFSEDGQQVITISSDNTARFWPFFSSEQTLADNARSTVKMVLSPEQRLQFFVDTTNIP